MDRGLGKGLDSLIPNYYDEDFDSNNALSLDDMLKENEEKSSESNDEDIVDDEINTEDIQESSEDNIDDDESNVDNDDNIQESIKQGDVEDGTQDSDRSSEISETSEDVRSLQGTEDSLQDTQELKKQENVAEVLDIVDKNPRITLWSSRSAAVFRYLRKTEPEFSISREASILIDEAVSKKYPHIWKLFEDI
ncbi:AAA family ATPase [Methanobrevibacter millerae]|uniref:Uncharacterized protein n=1 Tax=Methanobrevibacter millerae TaxID=230361 RepID=A0A1G5WFV5_9EURY|nr:AAA family ATPase [Methanobrevibacter millerae]SDA56407.1 hypothetical protein SAMN02910315_01373 [Methanobrevibacter millerae]